MLRQEDLEFEASLCYMVSYKRKKQNNADGVLSGSCLSLRFCLQSSVQQKVVMCVGLWGGHMGAGRAACCRVGDPVFVSGIRTAWGTPVS
jgi:hypothetical protein